MSLFLNRVCGGKENRLPLLKSNQILLLLLCVCCSQVAEIFTGSPGKYVDIKDTISGFKGVIEGKYDDLPEMAFYMVSWCFARPDGNRVLR